MDRYFISIHEIASMPQELHNLEIEYLQQAMSKMTMKVIQLKTGIKVTLAIAIPSIPKEQAELMDSECTPTLVVVVNLAIDPESQIKKGKKKLTPNEDL